MGRLRPTPAILNVEIILNTPLDKTLVQRCLEVLSKAGVKVVFARALGGHPDLVVTDDAALAESLGSGALLFQPVNGDFNSWDMLPVIVELRGSFSKETLALAVHLSLSTASAELDGLEEVDGKKILGRCIVGGKRCRFRISCDRRPVGAQLTILDEDAEQQFVEVLKANRQLSPDQQLHSGETHITTEADGEPRVKRGRFSIN